ncbi:MAG TPA: hypothetical protein PJ982_16820 [Lacipirellulaceae bacterium]|nr:hypothetical protein [Lacipirellulaceae bacterium]
MAGIALTTRVVWLAAAAALAGCQSRVDRVAVYGAVDYAGEPVADGQIAFEPKSVGKMEFAPITDGRYELPAEFGLVPGEYLVRIIGNRPTGKQAASDSFLQNADSLDIIDQYIPLKYNTGSQLTVEIPQERRVERNFSLDP